MKITTNIDLENHDFEQYRNMTVDQICSKLMSISGFGKIERVLKDLGILPEDFDVLTHLICSESLIDMVHSEDIKFEYAVKKEVEKYNADHH